MPTEHAVVNPAAPAFTGSAPFELDIKYFNNALTPECTWFVAQGLRVSGSARAVYGLELGALSLQIISFASEDEAEVHLNGSSMEGEAKAEECFLPDEIWAKEGKQPLVDASHFDVSVEGVDHLNTFRVPVEGKFVTYAVIFREQLEVGTVTLSAGIGVDEVEILELLERVANLIRQ